MGILLGYEGKKELVLVVRVPYSGGVYIYCRDLERESQRCDTEERVHRSAAQRRLTALGSVDIQLTSLSLSRLSPSLFSYWQAGRVGEGFSFFLFSSAGSTQERATS